MTGFTAIMIFGVAFGILTAGQIILAWYLGVTAAPRVVRIPGEQVFRLASIMFMVLGTVFVPAHVPWVLSIIGAGIMMLSASILAWAQVTLGRNWIPGIGTHKRHELITDGPYAWIRHPIYTAIGGFLLGGAIYCMNIFFLVSAILMWLALAIRIPYEEDLMAKKFKRRWTAYTSTTGEFLPRIHR